MIDTQSVFEVVDEFSASILANPNGKRRIRSGTFWNKFGFEHRTKERVEAVKTALVNRAIAINIEDSVFGSEKRGEMIVLRQTAALPPNKTSDEPSANPTAHGETSFESPHQFERIEAKLKHLAPVKKSLFDLSSNFSMMFVEIFSLDAPNYELSSGVFGATRSNWTYHTAGAISQTCKILNLTCKFEAMGKRDAIIETRSEQPEIVLAAEWEWDYTDIFGAGKELDKLKITCEKNPTADAFLLIYCPISEYINHLGKIADYWLGDATADDSEPTLFLHTIIFEEKGRVREFQTLKTVMIHANEIQVWSDVNL